MTNPLKTVITNTDMFCGCGGSSQGARDAGIEVMMAGNHWERAIETHQTNFPDTDHDKADIEEIDPRRWPRTTTLWASPECFPAGTLILAARGLIPIEDITIGDLVLTHKGRWMPVVNVGSRVTDTIVVRGQGHSAGIETTSEHPFLVMPQMRAWSREKHNWVRSFGEPEWKPAGALRDVPCRWATPVKYEPLQIPEVPGRGMPIDDPEFWWLVGRWLGDGTLRLRMNQRDVLSESVANNRPYPAPCIVCGQVAERNARYPHIANWYCAKCKALAGSGSEVHIACGRKKVNELRAHLAHWKSDGKRSGFGELKWREHETRSAVVFETAHSGLAEWLIDHFGRHAYGKAVPAWALAMPTAFRQSLLDGYVSADGHVSSRRTTASTVSKRLAVGIRLLAESLGHRVSLYRDRRGGTATIEGRLVNTRDNWTVEWENNKSQANAFEDEGRAWSLVKQVCTGQSGVQVYNLEVETDESFVADGIIVHNCPWHGYAQGRKRWNGQLGIWEKAKPDPEGERSRARMYDVPRFAAHHGYEAIIVENVVEARKWRLWDDWLREMSNLGYENRALYLNSMFFGVPQSRDRLYVVFWKKHLPAPQLDFRPPAYCPTCEKQVEAVQSWKNRKKQWGKYGPKNQYLYRCPSCAGVVEPYRPPALVALDLTDLGTRIGDRPVPLKPRTLERIQRGLEKYGRQMLVIETMYSDGSDRAFSVLDPLHTQTTRQTMGIMTPIVFDLAHGGDGGKIVPASDPLMTKTTCQSFGMAMPMLTSVNYFDDQNRPVTGPMPTQTTASKQALVVPPTAVIVFRRLATAQSPAEPLTTVSAGGIHHGILRLPFYVGYANGSGPAHGTDEPLLTLHTQIGHGLIFPEPLLVVNYTPGYCKPAGSELATITAQDHHALVVPMPFLSSYYTHGDGRPIDEPMATIPTLHKHALVIPDTIPALEDCLFRMLKPPEIGLGMGFAPTYVVLGNQREQVRQYGNAVTPPASRWLWRQVAEIFK